MGFFDSKSKQKSESSASPWGAAIPGLAQGIGNITGWMSRPMEYFPGQTYAGQTESEAQAIEQLKGGAGAYPQILGQYMQPGAQAFQTMAGAPQAALGMGLTDVTTNPAIQAQAEAIQSRVNRNLMENILPQIKAGEVMGPSGGVSRGIAARGTQEALSSALADLYGGAYQAGLGAETARYGAGLGAAGRALGALPGMAETALTQYTRPAALLGQAGGLERAEEQRGIQEAMARHEFQQMEPYKRGVMGLQALMEPATAFGTTKSETEGRTSPSTFGKIGQVLGAVGGMGRGMTDLFGGGLGGLLGGGNPYAAGPAAGGGMGMYDNPWTYGGGTYF